jgi:rhodanese-related sulfurtransferase
MDKGTGSVGACNPAEAWEALRDDPSAQLVDVRTQAEWAFVGIPDLSGLGRDVILQEWQSFPTMAVDPAFADRLLDRLGGTPPETLFFLCRSGARSMHAAMTVAAACSARGFGTRCVNVEEGFEGDLDAQRHRGSINGWKSRELAWRQS